MTKTTWVSKLFFPSLFILLSSHNLNYGIIHIMKSQFDKSWLNSTVNMAMKSEQFVSLIPERVVPQLKSETPVQWNSFMARE